MKKAFLAVVLSAIITILPLEAFATVTNTTIKSDKGTVEYSFNSDTYSEYKHNIQEVIGEWQIPAEGESVSVDVTVDFAKEGTDSNVLYLCLDGDTADVVNFFTFRIVSPNGEVLYDDKTQSNPAQENKREIYLTTSDAPMEFTLQYDVTQGKDRNLDISSLRMSVISKKADATVVPTEKPVVTPKPKFDLDSLENGDKEIVFDLADGTIKTPDGADGEAVKSIEKVVGKDIPADRYKVTGGGNLKITSANGLVKYEVTIDDKNESEVVLLEDGDVIKITALEGEESAKLSFNKASTDNQAPAKVTVAPKKTNPKTGEDGMGIGITLGIVVLIGGAIVGLEILKRKKNGNN